MDDSKRFWGLVAAFSIGGVGALSIIIDEIRDWKRKKLNDEQPGLPPPPPTDPKARVEWELAGLDPLGHSDVPVEEYYEYVQGIYYDWFDQLDESRRELLAELLVDPRQRASECNSIYMDFGLYDVLPRWATQRPEEFDRLIGTKVVTLPGFERRKIIYAMLASGLDLYVPKVEVCMALSDCDEEAFQAALSVRTTENLKLQKRLIDIVIANSKPEWMKADAFAKELSDNIRLRLEADARLNERKPPTN